MPARTAGARVAREPAPAASTQAEVHHRGRWVKPSGALEGAPVQAACLEVLMAGRLPTRDIHAGVERLLDRLLNRENVASALRALHRKGLVEREKRQRPNHTSHMWFYWHSPKAADIAACDKSSHDGPCSPWSHRYRRGVPA